MPQYIVVEFVDDGVPDIISSTWLEGRKMCRFPSVDPEGKMTSHIGPTPTDDRGCAWEQCPIRIIASRGK